MAKRPRLSFPQMWVAFRNCLKTRDTPNIVARLSVDAWKGTLTPTLSQREREPKESPLPRFGGEGQGEG
ncbi:MAG: hypothetical protein AB1733_15040, partial [Thermodesulfobacteriota bacterium]